VMVFRSLQELLGNAARHSQASVIKVNVDLGEDLIKVSVDDNGKGFDPEIIQQGHSLGLELIRERAEMLGGRFEIDSMPGKGARIAFSIPLHE
jgi:signal transduction histidine kinase